MKRTLAVGDGVRGLRDARATAAEDGGAPQIA